MLDLKLIREQLETVRAALARRGANVDLDSIVELDRRRRALTVQLDGLKAERNQASQSIGVLKRDGKDATSAMEQARILGDGIKELEESFKPLDEELHQLLLRIPNLAHESVPDGRSAADNQVVRTWGQPPDHGFELKDHLEIGAQLGLFDFERGAKLSGRGFPVYTGRGARLERALLNFFLDELTTHHGFMEMSPPFLVNRQAMTGTGQLPKMEEDMYLCTADDLFLIPTAEVPLTNLHSGEVLPESRLPVSYTGYSACFRREAGSWGKETRGFLRLHQFDKVEMVKLVNPEGSYAILEEMVGIAESLLQKLGLSYRVLSLCAGDLSFGAAKCYDLEVFAPKEKMWLEVSSISNFGDFQARRANLRAKIGGKTGYVHTLNGSALATPRVLVALLECYQRADGSLALPECLHSYMGGLTEFTLS